MATGTAWIKWKETFSHMVWTSEVLEHKESSASTDKDANATHL